MTELITSSVTMQPEFPHDDLTVGNASILQLMLANKLVARDYHEGAENAGILFRTLHPALDNTIGDSPAISHGTTIFEAIHAAVASTTVPDVEHPELQIALVKPDVVRALGSRAGVLQLASEFRSEMPRTAETIVETFPRVYTADPQYLVAGAAIERKIVLDALELRG